MSELYMLVDPCEPSIYPFAILEASVALTSLLPLFYDQAKSVTIIRQSMNVVKQAVEILKPGQVSIITVLRNISSGAGNRLTGKIILL